MKNEHSNSNTNQTCTNFFKQPIIQCSSHSKQRFQRKIFEDKKKIFIHKKHAFRKKTSKIELFSHFVVYTYRRGNSTFATWRNQKLKQRCFMNKTKKKKRTRNIPAELIGQVYLDPTYGPAFKELFDSESALKDFLDGVLRLKGKDKIKKISFNFEQEVSFRASTIKQVRFDIFATTGTGRFLDIEMQKAEHDFFIDRAILYKAFLIIKGKRDMEKSEEFRKLTKKERENHRYELPETISIWLCDFNLPKARNRKKYMDEWFLCSRNNLSENRPISIFPKNKYIIISLPNFKKKEKEVNGALDAWLYLLNHAKDGKELPTFGNSAVEEALNRIRVKNADQELLKSQVTNMSHEDDYKIVLAGAWCKAHNRGLKKGRKEGLEEGRMEGRMEARKEFFKEKKQLELQYSVELARKDSEIAALKAALAKRQ